MTCKWGSRDAVVDTTGYTEMILNPLSLFLSPHYKLEHQILILSISFANEDHYLGASSSKGKSAVGLLGKIFSSQIKIIMVLSMEGKKHWPYPCFHLILVVMPDEAAAVLAPWGDKPKDKSHHVEDDNMILNNINDITSKSLTWDLCENKQTNNRIPICLRIGLSYFWQFAT